MINDPSSKVTDHEDHLAPDLSADMRSQIDRAIRCRGEMKYQPLIANGPNIVWTDGCEGFYAFNRRKDE